MNHVLLELNSGIELIHFERVPHDLVLSLRIEVLHFLHLPVELLFALDVLDPGIEVGFAFVVLLRGFISFNDG